MIVLKEMPRSLLNYDFSVSHGCKVHLLYLADSLPKFCKEMLSVISPRYDIHFSQSSKISSTIIGSF